jgi:hypothetical protein
VKSGHTLVLAGRVLDNGGIGARELGVFSLANLLDVEGAVAAEDLAEDLLLVVEFKSIPFGLVECLLELLLLLSQ